MRGYRPRRRFRNNPWSTKGDVHAKNRKCAKYPECVKLWLKTANKWYRDTGNDGLAVLRANIKAKNWLKRHGKYRHNPLYEAESRLLRRAMRPTKPGYSRGVGSEAIALILEGDLSGIAEALDLNTVTPKMVAMAQQEIQRATQDSLKRRGLPKMIRLYRGGEIPAQAQFIPMTTSLEVARRFATGWNSHSGVVYSCAIFRERIAADIDLFQEAYDENEFLVHKDDLAKCVKKTRYPSRSDPRSREWWKKEEAKF